MQKQTNKKYYLYMCVQGESPKTEIPQVFFSSLNWDPLQTQVKLLGFPQ